MKWKNKKGKYRATGLSGCHFTAKKEGDTFILKMERSAGDWHTLGHFRYAQQAMDAAAEADEKTVNKVRDELLKREEMLEKIMERKNLRVELEAMFPASVIKMFRMYAKMGNTDRMFASYLVKQKHGSEMLRLMDMIADADIY
jgi:hypothetical protein